VVPLAALAAAGTLDAAGVIELLEGEVQIVDRAHHPRRIAVDAEVFEGDQISTGRDGEVHLNMADGGVLAVRPNTRLIVTRYRARGDASDSSLLDLATGAVRSITGWIGRYNPNQYSIRTPTATIGVRGTDHEPHVILPGSGIEEPGTYDKVNVGSSFIETKQGRVDVPAGRAAFSPVSRKPGAVRPRLLDRVPNFYRPTRHEDRLERVHERVQEKLQHLRDDRIQKLRERSEKVSDKAGKRKDAAAWREREKEDLKERKAKAETRREQGRNQKEGTESASGRGGGKHETRARELERERGSRRSDTQRDDAPRHKKEQGRTERGGSHGKGHD
jgi:hypothetical protein